MAITATSNNQQIVNARILAEMAVQFNIGADILGKGNRHVEKYLGAEKMSGDTVMVPIVDSGKVFNKLDLSEEDLSVARDAVPVSVGPLSTAAVVDQETLTLSIKNPEIMGKRVANLALKANEMAYKTLAGNAINTKVIENTDLNAAAGYTGRAKLYDVLALCEGSKLAGETFGVVHPLAWAKLIAMFQGNYAPNDKIGSDLYKNELGELGGIHWTKGQHLELITGKAITGTINFDYSAVFAQTDYDVQAYMQVPSAMNNYAPITNPANYFANGVHKIGDHSLPFNIEGVYSTDIFGNSTGELASFQLVATYVDDAGQVTNAVIDGPVFFEGPRQNVYSADYDTETKTLEGTVQPILTAGNVYLPPAVVWKRDDFLVAVKGLEQFYGMDSLTVPTVYREKGILPLRGLAWTNPEKAATIFRVDVLLGMAAYTRTSINAVYIQAN